MKIRVRVSLFSREIAEREREKERGRRESKCFSSLSLGCLGVFSERRDDS